MTHENGPNRKLVIPDWDAALRVAQSPAKDRPPVNPHEWLAHYFEQWPVPKNYCIITMWLPVGCMPRPDWGQLLLQHVQCTKLDHRFVARLYRHAGHSESDVPQERTPYWQFPDAVRMSDADIATVHGLVTKGVTAGAPVVVYDGMKREIGLLSHEFRRLRLPKPFGPSTILDLGLLTKASNIGLDRQPNEPLRSFLTRVSNTRRHDIIFSLIHSCRERGIRYQAPSSCQTPDAIWRARLIHALVTLLKSSSH